MKGFPYRDALVVALAGLMLAYPAWILTRPAPANEAGSDDEIAAHDLSAYWLEYRASHAPLSLEILHQGRILWQKEGDLQGDMDLTLPAMETQPVLEIRVEWPEEIPQAYIEFTLEPEAGSPMRIGFWGRRTVRRHWGPDREDAQ